MKHPPAESDIIHLRLFNTHIIVLNKDTAAREFFEKRSALYSDRYTRSIISHIHGLSLCIDRIR